MSTPLHSRDAVGLRPARAVPARITVEGITVHYGGPSPWTGAPGMPHARCASIWRAWQAYHIDGNGWSDIAYSSGVCPHGHRYEGRGPGRRTAANGTNHGNRVSLAVCYIAGAGDPLTDDAKRGFLDEADRFGTRIRWVHHDWKPTACPGDPLTRWVRAGCPAPTGHRPPPPPPAPDPDPTTHQEATMFLILEGIGLFAVVDGLPVGFPNLAAYAKAKEASPGTPVLTLHGKQAEHMWGWLTAKVARTFA